METLLFPWLLSEAPAAPRANCGATGSQGHELWAAATMQQGGKPGLE